MVAIQLHPDVVDIDAANQLTDAQRIHLRQAFCAMGPESSLVPFERLATHLLASENNPVVSSLAHQVTLLRAHFFGAQTQCEEQVRSIALAHKRRELQELIDQDLDAAATARKIVAELVDKGLIVETDGRFCPNFNVEHHILHV